MEEINYMLINKNSVEESTNRQNKAKTDTNLPSQQ